MAETIQQQLRRLQNNAIVKIRQEMTKQSQGLDAYTAYQEKAEPSFFGKAFYNVIGLNYNVVKGFFNASADFGLGVVSIIAQLLNDAVHIFNKSDETFAGEDVSYMLTNLAGGVLETLGTAGVTASAEIGGLFGAKKDWAYKEGGALDFVEEQANKVRTAPLNHERGQYVGEINSSEFTGQEISDEELIESRYYGETRWALEKASEMKNWWSRNVSENVAKVAALGLYDDALEVMGGNKFFELLNGVGESLGPIIMSSMIGGKMGHSGKYTAEQIKNVTSLFFATTIAGRTMNEAINEGADLQDAYQYALSHALTETVFENILPGGLHTSGLDDTAGIFKRLFNTPIGRIIGDFVSEGAEEVFAEFTQPGFEKALTGETPTSNMDREEFLNQVLFSFLAGGLASGGGATARRLVLHFNPTVDTAMNHFVKNFNKEIKAGNEEKALEKGNEAIDQILGVLNRKKTKGLIIDKNGEQLETIFTQEQKEEYVDKNNLNLMIEYRDGKWNRVEGFELNPQVFQNTINNEKISDDDYGISKYVRGRDLSSKDAQPVETNALNVVGKKAIDIGNQKGLPVIVYNETGGSSGFYNRNNKSIYINQAVTSESDVDKTISKHEMVHAIASHNEEGFNELLKTVESLVSYDKDKKEFVFKSEELKQILEKRGYTEKIYDSFKYYFEQYSKNNPDLSETETATKALAMTYEDIVAYFIEDMFESNEILPKIGVGKKGVFEKINNILKTNKKISKIASLDKNTNKTLNKIKKKYETLALKTRVFNNSLNMVLKNALSEDADVAQLFNPKIVRLHGTEEILESMEKAFMNGETEEIVIGNKRYKLDNIFNKNLLLDGAGTDIDEVEPQRLAPPEKSQIESTYAFDKTKVNYYRRLLFREMKKYETELEKAVGSFENAEEFLKKATPEQLELRKKHTKAFDVYMYLKSGELGLNNESFRKNLESSYKLYIKNLVVEDMYRRAIHQWKREHRLNIKTSEIDVQRNMIQKLVANWNKHYKNMPKLKNRSYGEKIDSMPQAVFEIKYPPHVNNQTKREAYEQQVDTVVELLLSMAYPGEFYADYVTSDTGIQYQIFPEYDATVEILEKREARLERNQESYLNKFSTELDSKGQNVSVANHERLMDSKVRDSQDRLIVVRRFLKNKTEMVDSLGKTVIEDKNLINPWRNIDGEVVAFVKGKDNTYREISKKDKNVEEVYYLNIKKPLVVKAYNPFVLKTKIKLADLIEKYGLQSFGNYLESKISENDFLAIAEYIKNQNLNKFKTAVDVLNDMGFDSIIDGKNVTVLDESMAVKKAEPQGDENLGVKYIENDFLGKKYFLNMTKPLDFREYPSDEMLEDFVDILKDDPSSDFVAKYNSDIDAYFEYLYQNEKNNSFEKTLLSDKRLLEELKKRGYDGVIIPNNYYDTEYFVFDIEQAFEVEEYVEIDLSKKESNEESLKKAHADFWQKTLDFMKRKDIDLDSMEPVDINEIYNLTASSDNRVIVGQPFALANDLDILAINQALKMAKIVVAVLPATWNRSFQKHGKVEDGKLLYKYHIGEHSVLVNGKARRIKLIGEIWVKESDLDFVDYRDLKTKAPNPKKSVYFHSIYLNSTANNWDRFMAENSVINVSNFDFAVEAKGTNINTELIFDAKNIDQKKNYIVVKAINKKMLDILKSIDYEKLANEGSSWSHGFTIYDLIHEFHNKLKSVEPQKVGKTLALTEKERKEIRETLHSAIMDSIFVEKNGGYVAKSSLISQQTGKTYQIKYKNINDSKDKFKVYSSRDYAFHTSVELGDQEIISLYDLVPLEEIQKNAKEKIAYDILKATNTNFIFYRDSQSNTAGFFMPGLDLPITFINLHYLHTDGYRYVVETVLHETVHSVFHHNPAMMISFAKKFADILYEKDSGGNLVPTKIMEYINKLHGGDFSFLLRTAYGWKSIKTNVDVYNLLKKADARNSATKLGKIDEILAQICGSLFTDPESYRTIFDGKYVAYPLLQVYSHLIKNPASSTFEKILLGLTSEFNGRYQKYLKEIGEKFPVKEKYSVKTLNRFIEVFTDGKYTTKSNLFKAYLREQTNKKRGFATESLDNMIFLASEIGNQVKASVESFQEIKSELNKFKTNIHSFLNDDSLLLLAKGGIFYLRNKFVREINKLLNKMKKAKNVEEFDMSELIETLRQLESKYFRINPDILEVFEMDSFQDFQTGLNIVKDALNQSSLKPFLANNGTVLKIPLNQQKKYMPTFVNFFTNLKKTFNTMTKYLKKIQLLNKEVFSDIYTLRKDYRETIITNIISSLSSRVNSETNQIIATTRAGKSGLNEAEIMIRQAIYGFHRKNVQVEGIIDVMKNPVYMNDFNMMRARVFEILEDLRQKMQFLLGNQDAKQVVTLQSVNEKGVIKKFKTNISVIQGLWTSIDNNLFRPIYEQLTVMFKESFVAEGLDPMEYLQKAFPQHEPYQYLSIDNFIKNFNPKTFGMLFAEMLNEVSTEFKSSLSDKEESLDEYNLRQISELEELRIYNIDNGIKYKHKGLNGVRGFLMNPQNFFRYYIDLVDGQVTFFSDFYREYLKANDRRKQIIRDFKRVYDAYNKVNKKEHERLFKEEIAIDNGFLIGVVPSQIGTIKKQVVEELASLRANIKETKKQIRELELQIETYKKKGEIIKDSLNAGEKKYTLQDLTNVATDIGVALQNHVDEMSKLQSLQKQLEDPLTGDKRVMMIERIQKIAPYVMTEKQSIQKGHIIAMYMGLCRELEMRELYDNGVTNIYPTNHYEFGNELHIYDNQLSAKKGHQVAKDSVETYFIASESKEDLKNYLEQFLSDDDKKIVDFAKQSFLRNYVRLDEEYFKKFGQHLPYQSWYIPFSSLDSDYIRDFNLNVMNRMNSGVQDGIVTKTTLGANTPLRIENIFSTIENHTLATANYSLERLITDFQNLVVNKASGTTFREYLTGVNGVFGADNSILSKIQLYFQAILRYGEQSESQIEKTMKKMLRGAVTATVGLNIPMMIKQFASTITIYIKNGGDFHLFVKNLAIALNPFSKTGKHFRTWLEDNNSDFFVREMFSNIPNMAREVSLGYLASKDTLTRILGGHVAWADNSVLVAVFMSYVERIERINKKTGIEMTQDEIYREANKELEQVLLFGVASTDKAFRSPFLNSPSVSGQMLARFQSENNLLVSAVIESYYRIKNGVKYAKIDMLRDLLAMLMSGLFSAFVSNMFSRMRGYYNSKKEANYELWVNDFMWNNVIGAIPLANAFLTSLIQFDYEKGVTMGFDPVGFPGVNEASRTLKALIGVINGENVGRKTLKAFEEATKLFGLPVYNLRRMIETLSYAMSKRGSETFADMNQFFKSQTATLAFNDMVKHANAKGAEIYVEKVFDNIDVKNEILNLSLENPGNKINFYNVDSFKKKDENGKYVEYDIPPHVKEKYHKYAQKTLSRIIRTYEYKRLNSEEKAKVLQRVINYYYNFMKAYILDEKKVRDMLSENEVIEKAFEYAIPFPKSPIENQVFSYKNTRYKFNGSSWVEQK